MCVCVGECVFLKLLFPMLLCAKVVFSFAVHDVLNHSRKCVFMQVGKREDGGMGEGKEWWGSSRR